MIRYVSPQDKAVAVHLEKLCTGVCGCRILCLLQSYGQYDNLADLWLQYSDGGEITAAIIRYSGDLTAAVSAGADLPELREFIAALGAVSVQSEVSLAEDDTQAVIMGPTEIRAPVSAITVEHFPSPKAVYALLEQCRGEDFPVPAYEDFLLDYSHRMRHGTALCCTVMRGETAVAFAMTTALSDREAVIGSVCTAPAFRRQGIGTACVAALIDALNGRKVFIVRHPERNEAFYRRLGFENVGILYMKKALSRQDS